MTVEIAEGPETRTGAYRHDAFFYAGLDEFVAGTAQFLREGFANGEAMLVVVSPEKIARLQAALGPAASAAITFMDMAAVGKNPARILPVWRAFVDKHRGTGRALRGIGEPVYPDRRFEELMECARHESLLNIAFDGSEPFWLLCPYDVSALAENVVAEARRTHPSWVEGDECGACHEYAPVDTAAPFSASLPKLPGLVDAVRFADGQMRVVRDLTSRCAQAAGFSPDREWDLVLAVNELATNSVRHGGGSGVLRVRVDGDTVVCELADAGYINDPLIGRVAPDLDRPNGRGLWIANQLCDLVQLHSVPGATTVRLYMRA